MDLRAHRIALKGEYDLARREEIRRVFDTFSTGESIVIDMSAVTFVDSTFLNALARVHLRLREPAITLVGVTAQIRRVLHLMGFQKLFSIQD
jgi:anti-anti-sigma factor